MSCPLCGDESVHVEHAAMNDPLLLMVAAAIRGGYMEHLRRAHPAEYAREHAREQEMNAAFAGVFGKGKR